MHSEQNIHSLTYRQAQASSSTPVPTCDTWQDLTETFQNAKKQMHVGEMIHLDSFSLYSSMAAIELMDPKMDIGCGTVRDVNDILLPASLTDVQLITIMDQLLACEMSWLDAHTLPQTVFSCVYSQRPADIPRRELADFIRLQNATMASISNIIMEEKVAEEEDFIAWTYGFQLRRLQTNPSQPDDVILGGILEHVATPATGNTAREKSLKNAISLRIRFRVQFYRTIRYLMRFSSTSSMQKAAALIDNLAQLGEQWTECPHRFDVDENLLNIVFDASTNRHLMTATPPRTAPLLNRQEAFEYLSRLLREFQAMIALEKFALPMDTTEVDKTEPKYPRCSLQVAMHCVISFASKFNPTVLTRSILSRIMLPLDGSHLFYNSRADMTRLIGTDMGLTEELSETDGMKRAERLKGNVIDLFGCFCRNRGRQRRHLLTVLRRWDRGTLNACGAEETVTVEDQEETDNSLKLSPSSVAAERNKKVLTSKGSGKVVNLLAGKSALQLVAHEVAARLMTQHWLLGFECDLYQEYEYAAVFFYVGYALTTMANATASLANIGLEGALLHPLRYALYVMDEARLWVCRALYSALEALSLGKQWNYSRHRPPRTAESKTGMFGSEELWYQQRFGVIADILNGPAYVDYRTFLSFAKVQEDSLLADDSESDIIKVRLKDAAKGFLVARKTLERAKKSAKFCAPNVVSDEILQLARVAVENSVIVAQLLRSYEKFVAAGMDDTTTYSISFKFKAHRHFPVIAVNATTLTL